MLEGNKGGPSDARTAKKILKLRQTYHPISFSDGDAPGTAYVGTEGFSLFAHNAPPKGAKIIESPRAGVTDTKTGEVTELFSITRVPKKK